MVFVFLYFLVKLFKGGFLFIDIFLVMDSIRNVGIFLLFFYFMYYFGFFLFIFL